MIRSGRIDVAVLGGMQVSIHGDLANWQVPNKKITGMGGAMDLAVGAKKVIVMMQHFAKEGHSKMVKKCDLPLTAKSCVNIVITDLGVFRIDKATGRFIIEKLAHDVEPSLLGDNFYC
jgi:3-oxoacid CoA-transferase B subunit